MDAFLIHTQTYKQSTGMVQAAADASFSYFGPKSECKDHQPNLHH